MFGHVPLDDVIMIQCFERQGLSFSMMIWTSIPSIEDIDDQSTETIDERSMIFFRRSLFFR